MNDLVEDPVHRTSYRFEPDGDDLLVSTWMDPGAELPAHLHPAQEERWSVLEGEVELMLDGHKRPFRPADGEVLITARTAHGLANKGREQARLHTRVTPAAGLQPFLEDASRAARDGLYNRHGLPTSFRGAVFMAELLERHRDDVVMCSPPRWLQRLTLGPVLRVSRARG